MAFEERTAELEENFASMNFDVASLCARKKLYLEFWCGSSATEIEETGEYDLEGLFIRLQAAVDRVGAKRVVLDTIETLFAGFEYRHSACRAPPSLSLAEGKGLTAIITGETGHGELTRHGLEEYVADCVIVLDHG